MELETAKKQDMAVLVKGLPMISNELTWQKIFGGLECEYGNAGQQTNDGGYIIIGTTASYGPGS
jgi:hypothetical protein